MSPRRALPLLLATLLLAGCGAGGEEAAACAPAATTAAAEAAAGASGAHPAQTHTPRTVPTRDDRELTHLSAEQAELVTRLAAVDRAREAGTDVAEHGTDAAGTEGEVAAHAAAGPTRVDLVLASGGGSAAGSADTADTADTAGALCTPEPTADGQTAGSADGGEGEPAH